MFEYLVKTPFKMNTPQGQRVFNKGEALRLSSSKAVKHLTTGLLVEKHVGLDLLSKFEARKVLLTDKLCYPDERAEAEAIGVVISSLKRHESLKTYKLPTTAFLAEVAEFNQTATGKSPISKIQSDTGAGEWAGYNCNIGTGCSHGCLYCYAERMATRFNRVESSDEWREEVSREVTTVECKKYSEPIMFPTTHDITEGYLRPYRCHLYNILAAGNEVVIVTKPHRASIEAICSEFSSFRDNMVFRFTIGGLNNETMKIMEPGAPSLSERLGCLRYAFEKGFKTSISSEPMLGCCEEAEKLYHVVEPFVTEDVWFGKMKYIGGLKDSADTVIASAVNQVISAQNNEDILRFVNKMSGLPKVEWKDSINDVIKRTTIKTTDGINEGEIK